MARVTYVKKAQQRFAQVTVKNEDGTPKRVPVMRRNGEQKVTKNGRAVFMTVKVADKTKPLPMPTCDKCRKTIEVGQPYKHITPKSGPYGGHTRYRCGTCPTWQVWEYSSSLSARLSEVSYNFEQAMSGVASVEEVQDALNGAAEEIRNIAEEKREGASNIESGFGHETQQSQELNDTADQLDSWADEVESVDIPELPEAEEQDCEECNGQGHTDCENEEFHNEDREYAEGDECPDCGGSVTVPQDINCDACGSTGTTDKDGEPTEEQMDEWLDTVRDACSILDESPV